MNNQLVSILSALLTPIVAVLGIWIAYRQWRTAQNKLKFDLFEKRLAVYDATWTFLMTIMTTAEVTNEALRQYIMGTKNVRWLFNAQLANYLDEHVYQRAIHLQTIQTLREGLAGQERTDNTIKRDTLKHEILEQQRTIGEQFEPFLALRH